MTSLHFVYCPLLWAILFCSQLEVKKGQKWPMTSLWQRTKTTPNNKPCSEWDTLQITTPEPLPKPELRWWPTQSQLSLGLFTVYVFVPYPQFFCLPRPCSWFLYPKIPSFSFHADNHWPCVFNYMCHLISQSLHSFIQVTTQNHAISTGKMLLLCQLVWDCSWYLRDFKRCS
jgi:hypothetical protein